VIPTVTPTGTTPATTSNNPPTSTGTGGTETPTSSSGVAGARTQGGSVGAVHVAANASTEVKPLHGKLPFTGLSLVTLVLLAAALASLGLFLRAVGRALDSRRRRAAA
jgi:hypothetical protein